MYEFLTLKEKVRDYVIPFYEKNDAGHRINHADVVMCLALEMGTSFNLSMENIETLIIAAYFHDKFAYNREEHHLLAYQDLIKNAIKFSKMFEVTTEQIRKAAICCLEHRSGRVEEPTTFESSIIRAADMGYPPTTLEDCVKRNYLHNRASMGREEAIQEAIRYNKRYKSKSKLYIRFFESELKKRQILVNKMERSDFNDALLDKWDSEL